jgi:hypothetical protein
MLDVTDAVEVYLPQKSARYIMHKSSGRSYGPQLRAESSSVSYACSNRWPIGLGAGSCGNDSGGWCVDTTGADAVEVDMTIERFVASQ